MVDLAVLPGFIAVILLFLAPPGPDMVYMLAVGLESGRRCAIKAILGIGTGMSLYAAAVVIGVGGLAQSHPALLDAVKLFGAAYLLWLAYVTIRSARSTTSGPAGVPAGRSYLRGVLVSLTNPKLILFFVAVLPQFIGDAQNAQMQLAMLGAVNVATEVALYGSIGVLAGYFHSRFHGRKRAGVTLTYLAAAVYVVLAVVIAAETLRG